MAGQLFTIKRSGVDGVGSGHQPKLYNAPFGLFADSQ
jgi:hypothetical protein